MNMKDEPFSIMSRERQAKPKTDFADSLLQAGRYRYVQCTDSSHLTFSVRYDLTH